MAKKRALRKATAAEKIREVAPPAPAAEQAGKPNAVIPDDFFDSPANKPVPEVAPPAVQPELQPAELAMVAIEIPLAKAEEADGYKLRKVEVKFTNADQRLAFKRLSIALDRQKATTKDGKAVVVTRPAQALRWLLEQFCPNAEV